MLDDYEMQRCNTSNIQLAVNQDHFESFQRACATEVRRRGPSLLYFKTCKESHACMNNKIQVRKEKRATSAIIAVV